MVDQTNGSVQGDKRWSEFYAWAARTLILLMLGLLAFFGSDAFRSIQRIEVAVALSDHRLTGAETQAKDLREQFERQRRETEIIVRSWQSDMDVIRRRLDRLEERRAQ